MNILFISPTSYTGGGQRWLQMLTGGLTERGHQCKIIFSERGHPGTIFHNILHDMVLHHLCYRCFEYDWPARVAAAIDEHEIDVLVVEHSERIDEIIPLCKRPPRVVFVDHTMCRETVDQLRAVDAWVDEVVCVSHKIAAKIDWCPAKVIHNACPPVPKLGINVREFMGIPKDAFVVGYIGRVDRNKTVDHLVGAAINRGWWLLIVGRGPLMGHIASTQYPQLKVFPTDVYYVGDWYEAMDVFCLPSEEEGFPLTPLEALSCGCRVAMTPVSDFPELFGDSIAFFPHRSVELVAAVENAPPPDEAQAIMHEQLGLDRMIEQYLEVLEG